MGVASEHEGHDFFLKLLNRTTRSHATVSSTSQRSLRVGEDAIVGESREAQVAQDGSAAFVTIIPRSFMGDHFELTLSFVLLVEVHPCRPSSLELDP